MRKEFPLRTILTVTTGRLLTAPKGPRDNGIGGLYEILEHITGEAPYTHSLGRFAAEAKPQLLAEFPELANADTERLDCLMAYAGGIARWLAMCVSDYGMKESYSIIGASVEHTKKNPITELVDLLTKPKEPT